MKINHSLTAHPVSFLLLAVLPLLFLIACAPESNPGEEGEVVQVQEQPIVNGSLESGWTGVGALTMFVPGYGYVGSFCTGTLIDPNWVLTAAHCLFDETNSKLTPSLVNFYVGTDANPASYSGPSSGTLYDVDLVIPHASYVPGVTSQDNDIGLLHLTGSGVSGVPTYDPNTTAMSGSWVGNDVFYVGYGVSNGATETGGGIKRSTTFPIDMVNSLTYRSYSASTGTCFGDSGGPGLFQVGGQWKVIGVNSTVAGVTNPCLGYYFSTRVDAFSSWISLKIGATLPSCAQQPDMCMCAAACQSNGTCNNAACQTLTCSQIFLCMDKCPSNDNGCYSDCYLQGTVAGQNEYDALGQCGAQYCADKQGAAYQTCVEQNCVSQMNACFTGNLSCEQMDTCINACPSGDTACQNDCYSEGSPQAQTIWNTMYDCFEQKCAQLSGSQWIDCVWQNCGAQIEACLPPANCNLLGGDCPTGTACWPTPTTKTDCYPSDGKSEGQPCNPSGSSLSCADGLGCITTVCQKFCTGNNHCVSPAICDIPVFKGIANVGICDTCTDGDQDGFCQPQDCDDANDQIYPGATEACDGVDNNCNNTIDEGCPGVDAMPPLGDKSSGSDLGITADAGSGPKKEAGVHQDQGSGSGNEEADDDGCRMASTKKSGSTGSSLFFFLLVSLLVLRRQRR